MLNFFWQQKSWQKIEWPFPRLLYHLLMFAYAFHIGLHTQVHFSSLPFNCTSLYHTLKTSTVTWTRHFHAPLVMIVLSHFNPIKVYSVLLTSCLYSKSLEHLQVMVKFCSRLLPRMQSHLHVYGCCIAFFCHDCLAEPVFDRSISSGWISKGPSLTTAQDCPYLTSSGIC